LDTDEIDASLNQKVAGTFDEFRLAGHKYPMEIRDPVHGTIEFNPKEVAVLDSPAFQRLRSIKQLGFGEFSFPGGIHNRYIHSIGASHLAGRAFEIIFKGYPFKNRNDHARLLQTTRLAALLHDIGHGPLSHSTEEVMPSIRELHIPLYESQGFNLDRQSNHEDYTIKFLTINHITNSSKYLFFVNCCILLGCVVALSSNLITMFIAYELLTLCTIPLIVHHFDKKTLAGLNKYLKIQVWPITAPWATNVCCHQHTKIKSVLVFFSPNIQFVTKIIFECRLNNIYERLVVDFVEGKC
jgi:HD superfamily phosphohydrolase